MSEEREGLLKVLGRKETLTLAFGTMIGWGWVMLAGQWVLDGGMLGALAAFIIGAVICVFVGLTYAELASALPIAGGELVYSYRALGHTGSWIASWAIAFAYVGVAAWESIAIATALNYLFPLPEFGYLWTLAGADVYFSWVLVGIVFAVLMVGLNYLGIKPAAKFQFWTTVLLLIMGAAYFTSGVSIGSIENAPAFTDFSGVVAVILMVPAMFVGFDVIPQSAEEINLPYNVIGKLLVFSILCAAVFYGLIILGISLLAPIDASLESTIPVAGAVEHAFQSQVAGKIMIIAGIAGILTSWNGFIVGGSRVLFAMGRAKMLPPIFGKLHPKYNTPSYALYLVGFLCVLSPFMGENALVWFVDASAFGTVIAYFLVAISFIILRKQEPELNRPYKVYQGNVIGVIAILTSLWLITLYLPFGPGALIWPYEWAIVALWTVIGIVLAVWTKFSYTKVSEKERERLIFGEQARY